MTVLSKLVELAFQLTSDIGGMGSFENLQIYRGAKGQLVPWNSFANLASFLFAIGFSIRAIQIYAKGVSGDSSKSILDAIMNFAYGAVIYAVLTNIDWNSLFN